MAELLSGQMPAEAEAIFAAVGAQLFPAAPSELQTQCECGEAGDLCKHLGAVFLLVAAELDGDPFVLFHLRGRDRQAVLEACRTAWGVTPPAEPEPVPASTDLPDGLAGFYDFREPPRLPPAAETAAWPAMNTVERLGLSPFLPSGDRTIVQSLKNLCDEA